jgi:hypothetical protein
VGIGAILAQLNDKGTEQVIAYASKSLIPAERNYSVTEGECLAIVWAVKYFRPYLHGTTFTLITNHSALRWLMTSRELNSRLMQWSLKLQEYDFVINYRPGAKHTDVDALSRIPPSPDPSVVPLPEFCTYTTEVAVDFDLRVEENLEASQEACPAEEEVIDPRRCLRCPKVGHVARDCPNRPDKKPVEKSAGTLPTNKHIRFNSDDEEDSEAEDEEGEREAANLDTPRTPASPRAKVLDIIDDHPVLTYLREGTIPGMMSAKERRRIVRRAGPYLMEDNILRKNPPRNTPSYKSSPTLTNGKGSWTGLTRTPTTWAPPS